MVGAALEAAGILREGEALGVAKAVSPSRALPLLATPLFCTVESERLLARCRMSGIHHPANTYPHATTQSSCVPGKGEREGEKRASQL